jgi:small multidrug resistance family-3 protein
MSALLWLFLAACLEAGGDAIVRAGLRRAGVVRIACFITGAIVLFSYAYAVNIPKWTFGRLLGVYVTLFFLVAQLIGLIFFHESPSGGTLAGGALILAGGAVLTLWR